MRYRRRGSFRARRGRRGMRRRAGRRLRNPRGRIRVGYRF